MSDMDISDDIIQSDMEASDEEATNFSDDEYPTMAESVELRRPPSFESLEEAQVVEQANLQAQEVHDILGIPKPIASILLRNYPGKEALIDAFSENQEQVLSSAGVSLDLERRPKSKKQKYLCLICDEKYYGKDTYSLPCNHRYCKSDWAGYLENALNDGPAAIFKTHCPAPKCDYTVHEQTWRDLLPNDDIAKFERFLNVATVTASPLMRYCPAPGCKYVMRVDVRERIKAVKCKCGFEWCFQCADADIGDHMPATCSQVASWRERASSESENIKWLSAHTKQCPKCRKPIEKNGGCMHMTCTKAAGGCGHEFCWLCRGDWKEHGNETGGYYSCNKYNASTASKEDQKSEQIRTELGYYMFYFHRYDAHLAAAKVADEQRKRAQERGRIWVEQKGARTTDVEFLVAATDQLARNRRVLRWSYVYAFYLENGTTEKNLFEFSQEELEKYTDALSREYEKKMESITDFDSWKSKVVNLTRVTDSFFAKFIQSVQQGFMK